MSFLKQAVLSLVILLVAAGAWYLYSTRSHQPAAGQVAGAGNAPGAGGQGGGQAGNRAGGGGPRPVVVPARVAFQVIGDDLQAVGSASAVQAVTIYPQVAGIVAELPVKPSDKVAKGGVILRLQSEDQRIAVDKAKLTSADADAALGRAQQLAANKNISEVAVANARSAAEKAKIDLRTAQLDLDKRTIVAPFEGMVGLFPKNVGDYVTTSTVLTTFDDTTKFLVTFDAPERFASRLKVGQKVTATADGIPGKTMGGAVTALDSRVDEQTRTFKVQATLDQGIEGLKPGMATKIVATFDSPPQATVPSLAVLWDRKGPYVWKLDGDAVRRTGVDIVSRRAGIVVVIGDLKQNDEVVVEGVQRLRDGINVARQGGGTPGEPQRGQGGAAPASNAAAAGAGRG